MPKLLLAVLLLAPQDFKTFVDDEFGVRLKYPSTWQTEKTEGDAMLARFMTDGEKFRPEIVLINGRMKNPTPVEEYKAQIKKMIQENEMYKDAKIGEPRDISASGRKGCQIDIELKTKQGLDLVIIKSGLSLGLRRYLIVDAAIPKERIGDLRKVYDQIIASIEFFAGREPEEISKRFAAFDEIRAKLTPMKIDRREELEILLADTATSDKTLGSYAFSFKSGQVDGRDGTIVETSIKLEIDKGGKSTIQSKSFVSNDLTYQKVEIHEMSETPEKRTFEYKSTSTLNKTQVASERIINGTKTNAQFQVPEGTVFSDLVEWLQWRLLEYPMIDVHVRVLSVYDEHTEYVQIEGAPSGSKRADEAYNVVLTKPDKTILMYYYSQDRTIHRLRGRTPRGVPQPIWMKKK